MSSTVTLTVLNTFKRSYILILQLLQLLNLDPLLALDFVRTVEIRGPMSYHSVTFVLSLPDLQPSPEIQANLSESTVAFGVNVNTIGGLPVAEGAPWGIQGFSQAGEPNERVGMSSGFSCVFPYPPLPALFLLTGYCCNVLTALSACLVWLLCGTLG